MTPPKPSRVKGVRAWVTDDYEKLISFFAFNKHQVSSRNIFNKRLQLPRMYKYKPRVVDGRSWRNHIEVEVLITQIKPRRKKK